MTTSCLPTGDQRCEPAGASAATPIDAQELAALCKALAHPARVRLLQYLASHGSCYFGSLSDVLPLAPSTISQHVSILKEAGLLEGSADERRTAYCVNRARMAALKQFIAAL